VTEPELERLRDVANARLGPAVMLGSVDVAGDIVFVPLDRLDAVGLLLDRRTGDVEVLRSALPLELYVWAKQRGFRLHGANQLLIAKVHQHDAAVELLRCAFDARFIRAALIDAGAKPLSLDLDWPQSALLIEQLRTTDAIDYEVNPL
jgi:hypothetical protein